MSYKLILEAISYAARSHDGQTRADGHTPYIAHPFRVMTILSVVFGVTDPLILATAILHDSIEDTHVNYDDLKSHFGEEVADNVARLSKDMRLPKSQREFEFLQDFEGASFAVKLCKLGDMLDNITDIESIDEAKLQSIVAKAKSVLETLESGKPLHTGKVSVAIEAVKSELRDVSEK